MMYHMFIRQEGNYYEYILHHSLSTFLIFFSFLMNMWIVGIIVLLLTDFSDFFLIFARWYRVNIFLLRIIVITQKNFYNSSM